MVKPMHEQSPSVKLLTILNVQSAKPPKKRASSPSAHQPLTRDWHAIAKKAKKVKVDPILNGARDDDDDAEQRAAGTVDAGSGSGQASKGKGKRVDEGNGDQEPNDSLATDLEGDEEDAFKAHFGSSTALVDGRDKDAQDDLKWDKKRTVVRGLGEMQLLTPHGSDESETKPSLELYNPRILDKLRKTSPSGTLPPAQENWLNAFSTYRDIAYTKLELGDKHDEIRSAASVHAMNHVLKTRTRILKNNEYLSKVAADPSSSVAGRETTDQGFTRPKVLVLCPFRNSALAWTQHLLNYSLVPQIENYERFLGEYSLPEGAVDKLVENAEQYPADHVETFKGNIDDAFRVGFKVNRKQVKVFSEFYQADVIVASPLGLRTSIEKEDDSDFLSSIEIVIVDQMDVMLMQNWEHVQFVMDRLSKMPEEDHGCDFSRVKPWYLDGKAPYVRQSILLSRYATPETSSLFSTSLHNQAGKLRTVQVQPGCLELVPKGVRQVWSRFDVGDVADEDDKRFEWFTQKTLPNLMKSAISSQQTIIFIPSYFDFVRVKRYLSKKLDHFSFTSISEYTPTPDVSRARGAFFSGKKKFLLVTERFHFFRRYRIRGAKTVVFYAPPSHPSYYPEFLSFPFAPPSSSTLDAPPREDAEHQVDESELSSQVVFSKFDFLRVERIVGTKDAKRMCGVGSGVEGKGESRFTFV
ncbi:hypothetical protein JCM10212_002377 [Sporobolomyces blumeae]